MNAATEPRRQRAELSFLRRTLIAAGVAIFLLTAWQLASVFLLAFGAIILAVLLRSFGDLIARGTRLPHGLSLAFAGAIAAGLVIGGILLLGSQVAQQFAELSERLTAMISRLEGEFGMRGATQRLLERAGEPGPITGMLASLVGATTMIFEWIANLLLIAFGAAYLAAEPKLYRGGLLQLVPPSRREIATETFDATGRALQLWLIGQLVAMVVVGVLTTLGLMLIGMPSALALGLITGLTNFVPFVGPVVAAVPALLIAASVSGVMILWTLALYVVIQQVEGNFITPMIERRVVSIPPALTIFAIVIAGILFGPLGVVFGAPLTVVAYVAVKKLYVRETLGEPTSVPGEQAD